MIRAAVLGASLLAAAIVPVPTTRASPKRLLTPGAAKAAKPPLDFTGVWELDASASRGVSPNMEGAVLSVRQNGNRIWIEPIEQKRSRLTAEEIVVDGRLYEKSVGRGQKGTLVADWGKDRQSLWLQAVAGTEEDPQAAVQRMVWRLREGGKIWTRQTWTIQKDGSHQTFLVFHKRPEPKP
jgi:hypothetical protein